MPGNPAINYFQFDGDSIGVAIQHGESLRSQIEDARDFYSAVLGTDLALMGFQLAPLLAQISIYFPDIVDQISALARAANQPFEVIAGLNARSELMNNILEAECTSIADNQGGLFAQNWDWAKRIAPLMSVQKVSVNEKPSYVTYTEPGMFAKMFMNEHGLAAQLNILKTKRQLKGVPVHLILKLLTESADIEEADQIIEANAVGKASHILLGRRNQNLVESVSYEFNGEKKIRRTVIDEPFIHTNHYLGDDDSADVFPTSFERYRFAADRVADDEFDLSVLTDIDTNSPMRPFAPSSTRAFGEVGTIATLSFNLQERQLGVRLANSANNKWHWYSPCANN